MDTARTSTGVLIREQAGDTVAMLPVGQTGRIPVRPGAIYQILSTLSLDQVPIVSAAKDGRNLVLNLSNGARITFEGYFDNYDQSDLSAQAQFDQQLPLQLEAFRVDPGDGISGVQLTHAHGIYGPDYGNFPPAPYVHERSHSWSEGILAIGGLVLGGVALAMTGLNGGKGEQTLTNTVGSDGNGSLEDDRLTATNSALDRAVQALVNQANTLDLTTDSGRATYDSIYDRISDLFSASSRVPSTGTGTGTGSSTPTTALDRAVQSLVDQANTLDLTTDSGRATYDSIYDRISSLLNASGNVPSSGTGTLAPTTALDRAVQALVDQADTLDLKDPGERATYDSIYDRISDLFSASSSVPSTGTGSSTPTNALDRVVLSLLDQAKALDTTDPVQLATFNSIYERIEDLLSSASGTSNQSPSSDQVVVNNYNYSTGTGSPNGNGSNDTIEKVSVQAVAVVRGDDYFTTGETITVSLTFTDKVFSTNPEAITLEFNQGNFQANYKSGIGTNTLLFDLPIVGEVPEMMSLVLDTIPLNLNGTSLLDVRSSAVNLGNFPSISGTLYLEPQPKIVEIKASPQNVEFFNDNQIDNEVDFFVRFDRPVTYAGGPLTLALNTGDQGAIFEDQLGSNGVFDNQTLHFTYRISNGGESNDVNREIIPLALAENGGAKVKSINGSNALVQIQPEIINDFIDSHEIKYDLSQPEIEGFRFSEIASDNTTIVRNFGGDDERTLLKVSGVIDVIYNEDVFISGDTPEIIISGLYKDVINDVPFDGTATFSADAQKFDIPLEDRNRTQKFTFSDLYVELSNPNSPQNLVDFVASGAFITNSASIIGDAGVPASTKMPDDTSIGSFEIALVNGQYNFNPINLNAGAGPFLENTISFFIDDIAFSEFEIEPIAGGEKKNFYIISAKDINGNSENYFDEYSGKLKDLSSERGDDVGALRAVVSGESIGNIFISPLSELHLSAIEASGDFSDISIFEKLSRIERFFGVENLTTAVPSFINQLDDTGQLRDPTDVDMAVTLAVLSTIDAVSGSMWNTIEMLTPIFSGDVGEEDWPNILSLIEDSASLAENSDALGYERYSEKISEKFQHISNMLVHEKARAEEITIIVNEDAFDEVGITFFSGSEQQDFFDIVGHQHHGTLRSEADEYTDYVSTSVPQVFIEYREWENE